jgi:cysteine desulfuration protein SufE
MDADLPPKLRSLVDHFAAIPDRHDRIQALIDLADGWRGVPPEVAKRPFPEDHRVPQCESEVYVFAEPREDRTLKFHFAVENPQGIAARALAVILDRGLSGVALDQVVRVPGDVAYRIFGNELSMGKGLGLMGMVAMVQASARRQLAAQAQGG